MKILNGKDLAEYIKERQGREVRALWQTAKIRPKLAIVLTVEHPTINVYVRMKKAYGADIEADVEIHRVAQDDVPTLIAQLNADPSVHGIIVQLPLERPQETEQLVNLVAPEKDVDALGAQAEFEPATPMAILWLLAGYGVDLPGKHILLVGRGKLVGAPLERMLKSSSLNVQTADRQTKDLRGEALKADIIITATGSPAILYSDMIKPGAVVVDAGVAGEEGKTVGDLAPDVYERDDLTLTPTRGGVGPLTVCALFENVIRAARRAGTQKA